MSDKYEYWLASILELSGRRKIELLDFFGSAEEIYKTSEYSWDKLHMIPVKIKDVLKEQKKVRDIESGYEKLCEKNIKLICWGETAYPEKLRNIYDMPYALFVKGKLPASEKKQVAIVGARNCSCYGQGVAEKIGTTLAELEIGVVSGLAYGIDAAAHIGAIRKKGATYAVMGCGVDICYPTANRRLYHEIETCGGVISEYDMGVEPQKLFFPMRNRLISALSDAVIIVEAQQKSGSLITADFAMEQGKLVYAVPGRVSDSLSYGTNWLLSQGASPFYSMEEFLKELGMKKENKTAQKKIMENALEKNERLVYSMLDLTPKHLDSIIEETNLNFMEVISILSDLQREGWVKEIYKNYYIRCEMTLI